MFLVTSYFMKAQKKIGITRTSVLATMEPVFAAVFALILLKQFLNIIETLGFVIIILSIFFFERLKIHKKTNI